MHAFELSDTHLFILIGYMMAIVADSTDDRYFVFDSHSRDEFGLPHCDERAGMPERT